MLALLVCAGAATCGPLTAAMATDEAARDFRRDYPEDCSADDARAIFEQHLRLLRGEQRAAISRLADELERDLHRDATASGGKAAQVESPAQLAAARQLLVALRSASDAQTAIALALQYRSRLAPRHQEQVAAIVDRLSPLAGELAQAKLAYQPHLAQSIRRRWELLGNVEKRAMLREYYYFAGGEPDWLKLPSSKAPLPLSRETAELLDSFEQRSKSELRAAERAFQPKRDALQRQLRTAASEPSLTPTERQAIGSLEKLLQADYGKGFRGLMLLEVDAALPSAVRQEVKAFRTAYRTELARMRSQRAEQLTELQQRLAPERKTLLEKGEFGRLFAIDVRLEDVKEIVRPLRILAHRDPGIEWPEEALLLDVRDGEYSVRFLRDEHEAWLPAAQVLLKPSSATRRVELAGRVAETGPGTPLGDDTPLREGQTLMAYHHQAWHPVTVVDVSPFGAVITWQGFLDSPQLKPRDQLRIVGDR